jgi:dienelactone hydrolase
MTAILPIALPVPRLLEPTGPYAIGTVTYYWVDDSRLEQNGPNPGDSPRELMVQIWYPAQAQPGLEPVSWHPDIQAAGPALANTLDMPSFLLDHLILARTHSLSDVSLATGQRQYPVLIYSHGLGGVRMQNTFQMEELASHGYIIAAIDHTFGGAITIFPDGRVALFDVSTVEGDISMAGNRLIHIWMEDGRFVLDQLEKLNASDPDNRFTGRMNLEKVGYFGHSTGGGTAFLFCQVDKRCGAGIALDGWLEPLAEEADTGSITRPFLFLKAEDWSTPENSAAIQAADENRQAEGSIITLPGTRHYNFSDLPLLTPLTPQMGLTGPANGRETLETINEYTLSFFSQHLLLPR